MSGPYTEYNKVYPYQLFDLETVSVTFWESQDESLWFE